MEATYDQLCQRALDHLMSLQNQGNEESDNNNLNDEAPPHVQQHKQQPRAWIGLGGAPGSGKTTVGQAVVERINSKAQQQQQQQQQPVAICLPMDGYHYSQQQMKEEFQYDMKRRGAPWTFDAESMCRDLLQAKQGGGNAVVRFPGYSRDISDPVPNQLVLEPHHRIVIVEGLYVLLGCLASCSESIEESELRRTLDLIEIETDWHTHGPQKTTIHEEISRWKPLWEDVWDDTWFVAPPDGLEENKRRLIQRSLQTWNSEKTLLWGDGRKEMSDREAAERRVDFNDMKNARLIALCQPFAQVPIDSI